MRLPDPLTLDQLRARSDASLQTLRGSYRPPQLPDAWERELAGMSRENMERELLYYAKVKHFHWLRWKELQSEQESSGEVTAEQARILRALLEREPERIYIAGRRVDVTFRGRAALLRMGEHDLARRVIEQDLDRLSELAVEIEKRKAAGRITRGHARRRLRHLRRIHQKYYEEFLYHTRTIIANALTPSGAAADAEDAPEWWGEITPAEEATLLLALFRAGPERLQKLGPPPSTGQARERIWVEDFGFWSLWSFFERQAGLTPAAFRDQDVAQFSAWLRAGAQYFPPSEQRPN